MKTIIEDDVLFTQREHTELRFERQNSELWVYDVDQFDIPTTENRVGSLFIHHDEELEDAYIDDEMEYAYEDIHYVYINNEVVTLDKLNLKREWE